MTFKPRNRYINMPMLLRIIGLLLLIEAGFMLFPLIASLCWSTEEVWPFAISTAVTAIAGGIMISLPVRSHDMGKREAILLTSMIWIILSLFGMLPFLLCGSHLSITDAFFETMSGFTTTGASVLNTLEGVPHGMLLWRCITQWIGGMGIILFTLAVLPMLNHQGGIQLFNAEVTGITHDKLRPRVSYTAKGLWIVYIVLTFCLMGLLMLSEMSPFDAICHGLSIMSTGGFSTKDMSISAWDSDYVKIVVIIFMFIGGVNFGLIFKAAHGNFRAAASNDAFRWYLGFIFVAYVLLCANVFLRDLAVEWEDLTLDPLFQAVSLISSTGITEPDFSDWGPMAVIVLLVLMFVGACAGSTSGGAKIDRVIVLFRFLKNEFYRTMHPNAVTTVSINGKGTSYVLVQKVLGFLFLYILVVLVGAIFLTLCGLPLMDSIFCALSAISNTGLGTDATGVAGNYALIPDIAKWALALIMLIGRLELYTVLLLFTRAYWKK